MLWSAFCSPAYWGSQVGSLPLQEAMSTLSSFLFQIKSLITHLRTKICAVLFITDGEAEVFAS